MGQRAEEALNSKYSNMYVAFKVRRSQQGELRSGGSGESKVCAPPSTCGPRCAAVCGACAPSRSCLAGRGAKRPRAAARLTRSPRGARVLADDGRGRVGHGLRRGARRDVHDLEHPAHARGAPRPRCT
eukprot:7376254-Prymnesium_polylepis.2